MTIRTLTRTVLVTLIAGGLAALFAGAGSAKAIVFGDTCPFATPNATLTVGPQSVSTTSGTNYPYINGLCLGYVVDVNAPPVGTDSWVYVDIDADYAGPHTGSGYDGLPLSHADCTAFNEQIKLYVKVPFSNPAKWLPVANEKFAGHWSQATGAIPGHCSRVQIAGDPPPLLETYIDAKATYRIAAGIHTTTWQRVRVRASYGYPL